MASDVSFAARSQWTPRNRVALLVVSVFVAAFFQGCAAPGTRDVPDLWEEAFPPSVARAGAASVDRRDASQRPMAPDVAGQLVLEASTGEEDFIEMTPGTGRFFDTDLASRWVDMERARGGEFTLNFEAADLREVVHFILGQLLEENYLLHPAVSGQVTLQTSRPLTRSALLPVLEDLLRLNGATLVTGEDGLYRVVPRDGALQGSAVPRSESVGPGLNVRIFPLRFIAAVEMVKILEPFLPQDALVRVDQARNLLMLAGSRRELLHWQETIAIFDVDWLEGMSVGLFTLSNADVEEVAAELERVTAADSGTPLAGLFTLVPVPRLNAVLVITPQARFLDEARVWIDRLDRSGATSRVRLHVYRMQHGRADEVAALLSDIYGTAGAERRAGRTDPTLAPGMEPAELGAEQPPGARSVGPVALGGDNAAPEGSELHGEVRVVADESNNSLLIMASDRDFAVLAEALRKMDISPLQVLVDATIIEVTLAGELSFGLQWFFQNSLGDYQGRTRLSSGRTSALESIFPGFNYSIVDSANEVRAVLSALASDSRVNVLSSPSVMVLDNQDALIRVGDQVPVRVSESTSLVTDDPIRTTNIQYRDTGVSLRVTPRVNAGGMVRLEIEQEVNDVSRTTTSGIDSPTIQQRLIRSSVSVESGDTIVLGGLIRDSSSTDDSGVPGLYRVPVLGRLFGATTTSSSRTELVVLLTPRVARDSSETRAITEDFRRRMRGLAPSPGRTPASCTENATPECENGNTKP